MIKVDINRLMSEPVRMFQIILLASVSVLALLNAFISSKFFVFLFFVALAGMVFFSIVPAYLDTLGADTEPLPRAGRLALRGAEAAGLAGVAIAVIAICFGLSILFSGDGPMAALGPIGAFLPAILILMVQATAGLGIAAGAGLTSLLRQNGVELEAPPPKPVAAPVAPPQQYQQPPQAPQGYQQPPQAPQGYQQPPQGGYPPQYPPQGGGGQNQGGQGQG